MENQEGLKIRREVNILLPEDKQNFKKQASRPNMNLKPRRQNSPNDKTIRGSESSAFFYGSLIFDFLIVNLSFFIVNYLKNDLIVLTTTYVKLLLLFNFSWFITSIFLNKFKLYKYPNLLTGLFSIARSTVATFYLIAVLVVMFSWHAFSRLQIFGSGLLMLVLEALFFSVFYLTKQELFSVKGKDWEQEEPPRGSFSLSLTLADTSFFFLSFFLINHFKRDTFQLSEEYQNILLVLTGVWFVSSLLTRKFWSARFRNIYYGLAPFFKSFFLSFATMAVIVFAFRLFAYSRLQVFGPLTLLLLFEILFYYIYFTARNKFLPADIESIDEIKKVFRQEAIQEIKATDAFKERTRGIPAVSKLKDKYLKDFPEVFQFIKDHIHISEIDEGHVQVFNTHTVYNIEAIDSHCLRLFVNLHPLNDFRRINKYFLEVHRSIFNGGYFVGNVDTIETHRKHFFRKYPTLLAKTFYPFHFLFKRIFPKIPGLKQVYFAVTRGKNRVLSKAETLGRLYFSGFKVLAVKEINDRLYYIAQRVNTPSLDKNPSYSPVIRLERVGYGGEIMTVYKLRTMHPYSEYLQEYIFENYSLQENGKFANDFRVTQWGKVFRRLWIDELPQLINFWRGDINLVGIRALSQHYFSLYPDDLKKLRIQFKPGLIPPYYADMPKSFEEIVESEKRYLLQKQQNPLLTDIRYFFRAFYNILFKKARSR